MITLLMTVIFGATMITAAYKDLTSYTIPNWISLAVIAGFFVIAPFAGMSWGQFGTHIMVFVGALIVMMGLFAAGGLGGGDAKLFAATSLWWMPLDLLQYTFLTAILGGVLAIVILSGRKFLPVKVATSGWAHTLLREEKKIPYGLALAPAALIILPRSEIFLRAALL